MARTCLLIVMAVMLVLAGCGGGGDGDTDGAVERDMMQPDDGDGMQPDDMEPEATATCVNQDMPPNTAENLPLGSLLFDNNTFGRDDSDFEQCLLTRTVDGDVQHGWNWDWPVDGQGTVRGHPSAIYGHKFWMTEPTPGSEIPIQVSRVLQLETLDASFEVELTADSDSRYVLHLNLLFNSVDPPRREAVTREVVIHLDHKTDWTFDPTESPATFGEHTYDVQHFDGFFGPTTWLRSRDTQHSGTIDLKTVLQYLVDRDFVLQSDYLASIELQTWAMEGVGEVWVREYEIEVMQPDDVEPEPTAICANQDMPNTEDLPLGSLLFNNNTFGREGVDFEQCLLTRDVDGEVQHGWSWDWPVDGQGEVRGLPSAIYGHKFWMMESTPGAEIPIQVSRVLQLETLDASFEVELTVDSESRYVLHLDLLFSSINPPRYESIVREVSIHLDHQTGGTFDPTEPPVTFGEHTYDVQHFPGFFGPTTFLNSRDTQHSGTIDLKTVLQYLVDRDFVLQNDYLASIELQTWAMEGVGKVWVWEYEVDVVE